MKFIHIIIKKIIKKNAEKYKNTQFKNQSFTYSTFGTYLEVIGYSLLSLLFYSVLFFGEHIIQYTIMLTMGTALLVVVFYRRKVVQTKRLELQGDEIIYTVGIRNKKETKINLNDINYVDINYFMFFVYLNNNKVIRLPMLFKNCTYIYAILTYHRFNKNSLEEAHQ